MIWNCLPTFTVKRDGILENHSKPHTYKWENTYLRKASIHSYWRYFNWPVIKFLDSFYQYHKWLWVGWLGAMEWWAYNMSETDTMYLTAPTVVHLWSKCHKNQWMTSIASCVCHFKAKCPANLKPSRNLCLFYASKKLNHRKANWWTVNVGSGRCLT